jgi:hypothetical protein
LDESLEDYEARRATAQNRAELFADAVPTLMRKGGVRNVVKASLYLLLRATSILSSFTSIQSLMLANIGGAVATSAWRVLPCAHDLGV